MEVYIIRHGETPWNLQGKMQGRVDTNLNENGKAVAIKLGKELSNTKIDRIYASTLNRAYETALLIRGDREIPIYKDDRLVEIGFGSKEGTTFEEWLREDNPYSTFFYQPEKYTPPEGAESLQAVMERTSDFLKEVIEPLENQCERVLIVAHGASNKGLMCRIENNDVASFWGRGLQENCQATVFTYSNGEWKD